jgi:hypothetical protein
MTKSFDFKPLSSAVAIALGGGLAATQIAQADAVFGPFFNTIGNTDTFVSLVTTYDPNTTAFKSSLLTHWTYNYKTDPGDPAEACQHSDGEGTMTENDLGTFDLGNAVTLPAADTTSTAYYIAKGFAGTFLVSDRPNDTATSTQQTLHGEVLWYSGDTGQTGSYRLVNNPADGNDGDFAEVAYGSGNSAVGQQNSEIMTAPNVTRRILNPIAIWYPRLPTTWSVAVVSNDMHLATNLANLQTNLRFAAPTLGGGAVTDGFFYDRNENRQSTSKSVNIHCFATLDLTDFVDPAGLPGAESKGGWAFISQRDLDGPDPGILVDRAAEDVGILVVKNESSGSASATTSGNEVDY